jgi:hypothetical protein
MSARSAVRLVDFDRRAVDERACISKRNRVSVGLGCPLALGPMVDLKSVDPETLRLELQEAIITFRHQIGLLIQMFGIAVTADSALIAYGFAQQRSGIFLAASFPPIAVAVIYFAIITGLIPIAFAIMELERAFSLREEGFMTRWIMSRHDLPFRILRKRGVVANAEALPSRPSYLIKDPKMLILAGTFAVQFFVFMISLTVYHYRFM